MLVHLLRHGVASDSSPTGHDDERPLTEDGRTKLREAAPAFRRALEPKVDRVIASPLVRAQQTAEVIYEACNLAELGSTAIETDPCLVHSVSPGVPLEQLIGPALQMGTESILLIGHEPQLGGLFGRLVTGMDVAIPLRKGMLVGIELPNRSSLVGRSLYVLSTRVARRLA